MTRLLPSIIAVALTSITSINLAYASTTASSTASSPASTPTALEVDPILPIANVTYNITKSLPIVFALQNLAAAASFTHFTFSWDIMPYGKVGEPLVPGGVTNDQWGGTLTYDNTTTDPYILVNQTDVQQWQFGPWYPKGSVYALQWSISWEATTKPCEAHWFDTAGYMLFNININSP